MNLQDLILKLKEKRELKKQIEKDLKEIEPQVKEELESRGIEKIQFPDIGTSVSYTTVNKSTIDEEKLLDILKAEIQSYTNWGNLDCADQIKDCIEMVPTVNEDKVQDLIYKGVLSVECIQPAYVDKSYKMLKLGKVK